MGKRARISGSRAEAAEALGSRRAVASPESGARRGGDRTRLEASREGEQGCVGQADAEVGVPFRDLDARLLGADPPVHLVGTGGQIAAKRRPRRRTGANADEVIDLGEDEGSGRQIVLDALVPTDRLAMTPVAAVEQRVDNRRVDDDHARPKPLCRRWRSTSSAHRTFSHADRRDAHARYVGDGSLQTAPNDLGLADATRLGKAGQRPIELWFEVEARLPQLT